MLAAVEQRLGDSQRELASQRERRRSQLARFVRRVRERDAHIERLSADVRGCDEEIERLRGANDELRRTAERRRAQATRFLTRLREPGLEAPPNPAPAPADSHLVFVQLAGRYELVEQAGPPPARNTILELPELHGAPLVVAGLSRSPLPGDARPCAFLTPAS
jgi:septal ring factor EnvC (AmiA/AmiB activator)